MKSQKGQSIKCSLFIKCSFGMQNFTHHSLRTSGLQGLFKETHNKELQHMGIDMY